MFETIYSYFALVFQFIGSIGTMFKNLFSSIGGNKTTEPAE